MRTKLEGDALLAQTLTWLIMVGYLALVYVLVVAIGAPPSFAEGGADASPPWWLNLIAIILIALTFLPAQRWVRVGVRDLVYSQHKNPYSALTRLNRQLESTSSPHDILPTIAEMIAQTLKLPFIEIQAQPASGKSLDAPLVVTFGSPPKGAVIERLPLSYHSVVIGELRVASRRWDEPLSPSDLSLLNELARHVGISLYAARLTEDLQQARERLVVSREEERRRIRNDLHDGLAPTLSSLQLQLGALRRLLRLDPDRAEVMLEDISQDLRGASAEIRRLVYDLRPPLLDELGLVGAIQNFKFPASDLCFDVTAPEPMPKLSAALEVALYRIASEALHNVVHPISQAAQHAG